MSVPMPVHGGDMLQNEIGPSDHTAVATSDTTSSALTTEGAETSGEVAGVRALMTLSHSQLSLNLSESRHDGEERTPGLCQLLAPTPTRHTLSQSRSHLIQSDVDKARQVSSVDICGGSMASAFYTKPRSNVGP